MAKGSGRCLEVCFDEKQLRCPPSVVEEARSNGLMPMSVNTSKNVDRRRGCSEWTLLSEIAAFLPRPARAVSHPQHSAAARPIFGIEIRRRRLSFSGRRCIVGVILVPRRHASEPVPEACGGDLTITFESSGTGVRLSNAIQAGGARVCRVQQLMDRVFFFFFATHRKRWILSGFKEVSPSNYKIGICNLRSA